MRSSCEPPLVQPATTGNLTDCVVDTARQDHRHVSVSRKGADGTWQHITAQEFLADVTAIAKGLLAAGIHPGDRIGIMGRTSYEWTLFDVAGWFAGAVTVPVYETSSPEQIQWILADSGCVACVVETTENAARLAGVRDRLPDLRDVWTLESGAVEELRTAGRDVPDAEVERSRSLAGPGDPMTIIYTSGTTGRPKGVQRDTGGYAVALASSMRHIFMGQPGETYFSTSDIGYLSDGELFLVDRSRDLVIVNGFNVYPAEIEAALSEHPDVLSCLVVGVPHEDLGQVPYALVQAGAELDEQTVQEFLHDRIAGYKVPATVEFVDGPLRDDAGKARRSAVRTEIMARRRLLDAG